MSGKHEPIIRIALGEQALDSTVSFRRDVRNKGSGQRVSDVITLRQETQPSDQ